MLEVRQLCGLLSSCVCTVKHLQSLRQVVSDHTVNKLTLPFMKIGKKNTLLNVDFKICEWTYMKDQTARL